MKTFGQGMTAPSGVYVSIRQPDLCVVESDGGILEGRAESYFRMTTALAVAMSPAIGGLFVMLFPLVVLFAVGVATTHLVSKRVRASLAKRAYLGRMSWAPTVSYLKQGEEKQDRQDSGSVPELDSLRAEVSKRREAERTTDPS